MSEKTCGYHALDDGVHDACPYCTRIRLAALEAEIEQLRVKLHEARELLETAVDAWDVCGSFGFGPGYQPLRRVRLTKAWRDAVAGIVEVSDE